MLTSAHGLDGLFATVRASPSERPTTSTSLCFANSKTLLRKVLKEPQYRAHTIVETHINYHAEATQYFDIGRRWRPRRRFT